MYLPSGRCSPGHLPRNRASSPGRYRDHERISAHRPVHHTDGELIPWHLELRAQPIRGYHRWRTVNQTMRHSSVSATCPVGLCPHEPVDNTEKYIQLRAERAILPRSKPRLSLVILPQVHLRKPCYDFYFLHSLGFGSLFSAIALVAHCEVPIRLPQRSEQSVVATGGVYKGQGRNQHELMTRAYWEFLVNGE